MAGRATKQQRFAYEPDYVTEPGAILQETIDGLGITQKEFAARTAYSTKHVNQLITGKARITPDAAVRLERVTQVPARFWNNLETQFQDRKSRLLANETVEDDLAWLKTIPTKELIKRSVIPVQTSLEATLSFFGVASVAAWRAGWSKHQIAFRKSAGSGTDVCTGGIAVWVRLAELTAAKVDCETYDADRFQSALQQIRLLTMSEPAKFVSEMSSSCAAAGVALALVPEIPGSRVSGGTLVDTIQGDDRNQSSW